MSGMNGFGDVPVGGDYVKESDVMEMLSLTGKDAPREGYELRPLWGKQMMGFKAEHWLYTVNPDPKAKKRFMPRSFICPDVDPATGQSVKEGATCLLCKAGHTPNRKVFFNVLSRELQENMPAKPKQPTAAEDKSGFRDVENSQAWTPVRVVQVPTGVIKDLKRVSGANKHVDPKDGQRKSFDVSHSEFGCDITLSYNPDETPAKRYAVIKGDHSPLTEDEKYYLRQRVDTELLFPPSTPEAQAKWLAGRMAAGDDIFTKQEMEDKDILAVETVEDEVRELAGSSSPRKAGKRMTVDDDDGGSRSQRRRPEPKDEDDDAPVARGGRRGSREAEPEDEPAPRGGRRGRAEEPEAEAEEPAPRGSRGRNKKPAAPVNPHLAAAMEEVDSLTDIVTAFLTALGTADLQGQFYDDQIGNMYEGTGRRATPVYALSPAEFMNAFSGEEAITLFFEAINEEDSLATDGAYALLELALLDKSVEAVEAIMLATNTERFSAPDALHDVNELAPAADLPAPVVNEEEPEAEPEPEPAPRGRGRSRDAEPEPETSGRRRGRSEPEPEPEDEPAPRGGRRGRAAVEDDLPEEPAPRGGRRGRAADPEEDETPPPASRRESRRARGDDVDFD